MSTRDKIASKLVMAPTSVPHTSPFTLLFNKNPEYTFFRVIGCLCYPLIRSYTSHKLQFRSLPCVFLDYCQTQKGYKCLHIPTKKIYISRNVRFDETKFSFASSNTLNSALSTANHQVPTFLPLLFPAQHSPSATVRPLTPSFDPAADPTPLPYPKASDNGPAPLPDPAASNNGLATVQPILDGSSHQTPTPGLKVYQRCPHTLAVRPATVPSSVAGPSSTEPSTLPVPSGSIHPMTIRKCTHGSRLNNYSPHAMLLTLNTPFLLFLVMNRPPSQWQINNPSGMKQCLTS